MHTCRWPSWRYTDVPVVVCCHNVHPYAAFHPCPQTNPIGDWSTKYSGKKKGLSEEEVALYGRQVLEAMAFLYDKGFPQIGHVHSGNVIVEENLKCCRYGVRV